MGSKRGISRSKPINHDSETNSPKTHKFLFAQSTQLDEGIDGLSPSSSSSSESISYLLEMAQQMIANYPTEEQLAGMIAENYLNYIAEVMQAEPLSPAQPQAIATAAQVTALELRRCSHDKFVFIPFSQTANDTGRRRPHPSHAKHDDNDTDSVIALETTGVQANATLKQADNDGDSSFDQ